MRNRTTRYSSTTQVCIRHLNTTAKVQLTNYPPGHGGQTADLDGDEDDGYDEVIYPVDFRTAGHIVDDEMHRIMVSTLQPGVRLTAIFDSCHSGSALDLPYISSTQGVLKEPNLAKEAGQGLLGIVSSYARNDIGGMLSTASTLFKKVTKGDDVYKKNLRTKTSPADVIMWSGSKDTQTSADASIGGEATGAMSWAFITALRKNPNQSYVQLLNSIREELEGKYQQKPQLSCSHPLSKFPTTNTNTATKQEQEPFAPLSMSASLLAPPPPPPPLHVLPSQRCTSSSLLI